MPLTMLEKQVYQSNQEVQILTNLRSITFTQLRPIDMMAKVLKNIDVNSNSIVEEFEEFA